MTILTSQLKIGNPLNPHGQFWGHYTQLQFGVSPVRSHLNHGRFGWRLLHPVADRVLLFYNLCHHKDSWKRKCIKANMVRKFGHWQRQSFIFHFLYFVFFLWENYRINGRYFHNGSNTLQDTFPDVSVNKHKFFWVA